ncbi:MAG: metalloregulator ArsR/SmtB family transcription factor [Bacteroidota bacterium]
MGLTKLDQFTAEQNALAMMTKALGHPARIAILQYLLSTKTCITKDLVNELPLAQPTVSQHLKELKRTGLVEGVVKGTSVSYHINETQWKLAQQQINRLFNQL